MALAAWNGTITDAEGNIVSDAQITVRNENTGRLALLFSDRDGTQQISNPFTAGSAHVRFHTEGGSYSVLARKGEFEAQWRHEAVGTAQEVDIDLLASFLETGTASFRTKAELDQFVPGEEQLILGAVQADPDYSLNGYYTWNVGTEQWEFARPFPETLARLVNINGSANARTADAFANVAFGAVTAFFGFVEVANTGPMTLSINGESPARAVVNAAGLELSEGEFEGGVLFFLNDDNQYQLINDASAAVAAANAAVEAGEARDAAQEWAQSPDPISEAAGGDGESDRSAKWWAEQAEEIALPDNIVIEPKLARRLSARIGAMFDTVAGLLADTTLSYSNVSPGDIITAQGSRYEVAASNATDAHVETAGGVKLREAGPLFSSVDRMVRVEQWVDGGEVSCAGYYHEAPGVGGGRFYWDAASTETADGGLVFGEAATGRWKRIAEGPLCATDYGALPGDVSLTDDALSRMPPAEYLFRHTLDCSSFEWAGPYKLDMLKNVQLNVDIGTGTVSMSGDRAEIGYAKIFGLVEFGGPNFASRSNYCRIGDLDIVTGGAGWGLILRPASFLEMTGRIHVHCSNPDTVNQGVYFNTLKGPTLGDFLVTGFVSQAYQFAGNATVEEFNIEDGYIRSLTTRQDPDYEHVQPGHHGLYMKGCIRTHIGPITVYADKYINNNYNVKIRDNTDCVFNGIISRSADGQSRDRVFITSDANTLVGVVNVGNVYRDIDANLVAFETSPGVNGRNQIQNFKGSWTSSTLTGPFLMSGAITFTNDGDIQIAGVEFLSAEVEVPNMSPASGAQFIRDLVADGTKFRHPIVVRNRNISLLNCRMTALFHLRSTGSWTVDVTGSYGAGNFQARQEGSGSVTANISSTRFAGNENATHPPTNKNYKYVSFADVDYTT